MVRVGIPFHLSRRHSKKQAKNRAVTIHSAQNLFRAAMVLRHFFLYRSFQEVTYPMTKRRRLRREDKQLANRIRSFRQALGLTQEELAARLGVSPTYIAHVETYWRGLSLPVLYRLAKVFGIPLRDLFPG
jgi:putative transcriptional regulator